MAARLLVGLSLTLSLLLPVPFTAQTPQYSRTCDWRQALMGLKQTPVGYITWLELDPLAGAFAEYPLVLDPLNPGKTMRVLGVVESVTWGSGAGAPISFNAYISADSAFQISSLLKSPLKSAKLRFTFVIYDYDAATKMYYQGFFPVISDSPRLTGVLTPQSSNPQQYQIQVAGVGTKVSAGPDVTVYGFFVSISPPGGLQQQVAVATSPKLISKKPWGL